MIFYGLWNNNESQQYFIMVLSDAFDTAVHDLLLDVFKGKFSITNTALKWYKNYLKSRKFKVCINGSYSSEQIMDFGIPQGSTQGANLFICYTSTLSKIVPELLTLNGFTNDHSIRRIFIPEKGNTNKDNKASSEDDTIMIIGRSMWDIKAWIKVIRLKLNEAKTDLIYFGSRQQLNKTTHNIINVIGESIERSTKVRYLEGHLDSILTLKEHILIKCKAAVLNIIKIWNIRKYLTKEMCHKLILQLVISHLDYANSMLAGLPVSSIKIMQKIQNTAARLILGKTVR